MDEDDGTADDGSTGGGGDISGDAAIGTRHLYGCNKCDGQDKTSLLEACNCFFGTPPFSANDGSLRGGSLVGGTEGSLGDCSGDAHLVGALTAVIPPAVPLVCNTGNTDNLLRPRRSPFPFPSNLLPSTRTHPYNTSTCPLVTYLPFVQVLTAEDVLPRLRAMQRMDLVDVEGAAAVHTQLIRLLQRQRQLKNPDVAAVTHPNGVHDVGTPLISTKDEDAPLHDTLLHDQPSRDQPFRDTPLPWRDVNEAMAMRDLFDSLHAQQQHQQQQQQQQQQHHHLSPSSGQSPIATHPPSDQSSLPPHPPPGQPRAGSEWTARVQGLVEKLWSLRVTPI